MINITQLNVDGSTVDLICITENRTSIHLDFAEWVDYNCYRASPLMWSCKVDKFTKKYNTEEIFGIFLKEREKEREKRKEKRKEKRRINE